MRGEGERLLGVGRHASSPPLLFIEPFAAFAPSPRSVEAGDAAMLWLFCFLPFLITPAVPAISVLGWIGKAEGIRDAEMAK
jgi:hypothetical protein